MLKKTKKILHFALPTAIDKRIGELYFNYQLRNVQLNHKRALKKVRKKEKIKVVFLILSDAEWKYEELYRLMERDCHFEPSIVIFPFIAFGEETMLRQLNQAYEYFKNNKYNVVKTLNEKSGEWLDVNKEIQPDIVFFSVHWDLTRPEYNLKNYKKILTCYVTYTFVISYLYQGYFNQEMQNFVWKFFLETPVHQQLSKQYAHNKGINTIVSGYPGMDKLLQKNYRPVDVWKIKDKKVKRIIWSPHHTIQGMGCSLDYSTFFKYFDFMFDIAGKYQEHIQIAFKPHPLLRAKLSEVEVWGKERTDTYYQKWAELPNGQLNESEYINLFSTSDGLINDSSAFVIEYLYTNKPSMFLAHDDSVSDRFNEIGKMALTKLYIGKCEGDIEKFIKNVILKENDLMKDKRIHFFNSVIKPPNNTTATENIYNYLKSEIFGNEN